MTSKCQKFQKNRIFSFWSEQSHDGKSRSGLKKCTKIRISCKVSKFNKNALPRLKFYVEFEFLVKITILLILRAVAEVNKFFNFLQ